MMGKHPTSAQNVNEKSVDDGLVGVNDSCPVEISPCSGSSTAGEISDGSPDWAELGQNRQHCRGRKGRLARCHIS